MSAKTKKQQVAQKKRQRDKRIGFFRFWPLSTFCDAARRAFANCFDVVVFGVLEVGTTQVPERRPIGENEVFIIDVFFGGRGRSFVLGRFLFFSVKTVAWYLVAADDAFHITKKRANKRVAMRILHKSEFVLVSVECFMSTLFGRWDVDRLHIFDFDWLVLR